MLFRSEHVPPHIVLHRITGDGPKKLLLAPAWSGDKKRVLNRIHAVFRERNTWQGRLYEKQQLKRCANEV